MVVSKNRSESVQSLEIVIHSVKYFGVNPNQVLARVTVQGMNDNQPFGYFVALDKEGDTDIARFVIDSINTKQVTVLPTDSDIPAYLAKQAREQRDRLLSETDYLVNSDYPITQEDRSLVIAYRQALRDITEQPGFPETIVWPMKPTFLLP